MLHVHRQDKCTAVWSNDAARYKEDPHYNEYNGNTAGAKDEDVFYSLDNILRLASHFQEGPSSCKEFRKRTSSFGNCGVQLSDSVYKIEGSSSEDEAYLSGSSEKAASLSGDDDHGVDSQDDDSLISNDSNRCGEVGYRDEGHGVPDPTMRDCGKLPSGATTRLGWVRPLSPPSSHPGTEGQFSNVTHCTTTEPSEGVAIAVTSSGAQQGTATQRLDVNGEEDENEEEKEAVTSLYRLC